MRKFLRFSSWRCAHVFPFFLKELKKYGVTTLVRVCDATYDQAPIEKEGIQVLVSCLYHCLYMRTACPRELGTASCFGKSLWLLQNGQNLCAPLQQPKLVLRNSLCFCEMYLLMNFCSRSALVGIEMSAPGFLDWLRHSGCILVTKLILMQREIPGLCSVQPRVSHNLLSPFHGALVGFPFTAALLRMKIKLPSLTLRSCCVKAPSATLVGCCFWVGPRFLWALPGDLWLGAQRWCFPTRQMEGNPLLLLLHSDCLCRVFWAFIIIILFIF